MDLKYYLDNYTPSVLNLGCGKTCPPDHYGIDIADAVGVDQVWDLTKGIPVPTTGDEGQFDIVTARDFLEHIPQGQPCVDIMQEIYRVLKPGGRFETLVPSTSGNNLGAFQDPYHVSFWNKTKFYYFLDDKFGNGFRGLYGTQCWFEPMLLETFDNEYDVTYVRAVLKKKELTKD